MTAGGEGGLVAHLEMTPSGRIMRADASFCGLVGRTEDELAGVFRLVDLLAAGDRIYHESVLVPMLRLSGHVSDVAMVLERPDGARVPVLVTADLERTASGSARQISCRIVPTDG